MLALEVQVSEALPLTLKQAATRLGMSYETARRYFSTVDGVIRLKRPETLHKRRYQSVRVPQSVFFRQKQTRELLGQRELSMSEVVQMIGKKVGKPDLRYTQAPDEQVRPALIQLGMSPNVANLLLEMSAALNSGYMRALEQRSAQNTTPTSYETFLTEEFVPLYEGKSAAA